MEKDGAYGNGLHKTSTVAAVYLSKLRVQLARRPTMMAMTGLQTTTKTRRRRRTPAPVQRYARNLQTTSRQCHDTPT
jgi:hypothetical protein